MSPSKKGGRNKKVKTSTKLFWLALVIHGIAGSFGIYSTLAASVPPIPISAQLIAGKKIVEAKVVRADAELQQGLSGISQLGENEGMIFLLPKKSKTKFHMKGVKIPLSIAYLDWRGKILKIEDMDPKTPERIYEAPDKTRYALEMNRGWFDRSGLKKGDSIRRKS